MLMIRPPPPWAIICLAASCVPKKALLRLISITLSYCASVVSRIDVRVSTPALLTMMSSATERRRRRTSMSRSRSSTLLTSASTPIDLVTERDDLLLEVLGRLLVGDVVDDDVGPGLGERQHDRLADAAVATGDDGYLARECVMTLPSIAVGPVADGLATGGSDHERCSVAEHGRDVADRVHAVVRGDRG